MVLDQTDLYHLKDQSQTLTENKENDDGGQYKTCLLSPPPQHPVLAPAKTASTRWRMDGTGQGRGIYAGLALIGRATLY